MIVSMILYVKVLNLVLLSASFYTEANNGTPKFFRRQWIVGLILKSSSIAAELSIIIEKFQKKVCIARIVPYTAAARILSFAAPSLLTRHSTFRLLIIQIYAMRKWINDWIAMLSKKWQIFCQRVSSKFFSINAFLNRKKMILICVRKGRVQRKHNRGYYE